MIIVHNKFQRLAGDFGIVNAQSCHFKCETFKWKLLLVTLIEYFQ